MATITLRIVDGPKRGRLCQDLSLPVTIGREKGNIIDIDDSRVSRFHLKIFQEGNHTLLVDLGSTNGTKVNGETIQIWALRPGDLIMLGNSMLLFGSQAEIAERLRMIREKFSPNEAMLMGVIPSEMEELLGSRRPPNLATSPTAALLLEDEISRGNSLSAEDLALLRALFPPTLPDDLSPAQEASVYNFLLYFTLRLRMVLHDLKGENNANIDVQAVAQAVHEAREKNDPMPETVEKVIQGDARASFSAAQVENLLDLFALFNENMEQMTQHKH